MAFFSTSCSIYDQHKKRMQGGDTLNPGPAYTQFCIERAGTYFTHQGIFALPDEKDTYSLFHLRTNPPFTQHQCQVNDLLYTQIDMMANNGRGKVLEANRLVFSGCIQTVTANQHANGRDWWILVAENKEPRFYRYLYHPDGRMEGPWLQTIENPAIDTFQFCSAASFTRDGAKYIISYGVIGIAIYDFDRCTGLLSNMVWIKKYDEKIGCGYGLAISPDSRYLYVTDNRNAKVQQYDLRASNIGASETLIGEWDGTLDGNSLQPTKFGFMQHGPDGKIYIWGWSSTYMHVIHEPNKPGVSARLQQRVLKFPWSIAVANFYYPNYRLGPLDGSPCDTLGLDNRPVAEFRYDAYDSTKIKALQFTDVSWYEPTYWRWDFGDPASGAANKSTEQNPAHEFSKAGGYTVCLIAGNQYASDTICKKVWVGVSNTHALPALPQARLSPNPATDYLHLSLPALLPAHALRFALTDAQGRVLREVQVIDFETDISIADLPRGLYFWHLKVEGEVVQAGKVVK